MQLCSWVHAQMQTLTSAHPLAVSVGMSATAKLVLKQLQNMLLRI